MFPSLFQGLSRKTVTMGWRTSSLQGAFTSSPPQAGNLFWNNYPAPSWNAGGVAVGGDTPPAWVDYYQNWYTVVLEQGLTYPITLTASGGPSAILSIQNSSGTQVAFAYTAGSPVATLNFSPTATGTYTIICSTDSLGQPSPGISLALTIPAPGGNIGTVTTVYPGVDVGQPTVSITVKVTAPGGSPPGSVTLNLDGNPVGTMTLSNGSAVFSIP